MKVRQKIAGLVAALLLVAGSVLLVASPAYAHEDREVLGGKYQIRVGFITEPTYQGLENGLELGICNGKCENSKEVAGTFANGVTGLFDTLQAEVSIGSQSMPLKLLPVARNPGRYQARFIPTRVGDYTFHIFGTINNEKIDEKFTSSPNGFDSVQAVTIIQFPDKPGFGGGAAGSNSVSPVPTSASAPTTAASTNATTATAPTPAAVATTGGSNAVSRSDLESLQQQLQRQQQQSAEAKAGADTALLFGIIGLIVGALGLLTAVVVWVRSRAPRPAEGG